MTDTSIYQEAMDSLVLAEGNKAQAARDLGLATTTYKDRLSVAEKLGMLPSIIAPDTAAALAEAKIKSTIEIKRLKAENKALTRSNITAELIREVAFGLAKHTPVAPSWIEPKQPSKSGAGIPTFMLSDFHWGESIDSHSIGGINEYNLEIAQRRLKETVETAIDLCTNHVTGIMPEGIVVALGGDMVSGDIHEELAESNEIQTIPAVLDIFEHLISALNRLIEVFGKVFVPCAYGNHGRNTKGYRFKGAAETNFDWMLYNLLERHYKAIGETRIQFLIPTGFDAIYSIYGHNYLLTHGDRLGVRGGGGILGMLPAIMRGVMKVKAQHDSMGNHIDTVIMGHFHQYIHTKNVVVNGSLKGYDEYAAGGRFDPECATQALWYTHPEHGVTLKMPVYCGPPVSKAADRAWCSVLV